MSYRGRVAGPVYLADSRVEFSECRSHFKSTPSRTGKAVTWVSNDFASLLHGNRWMLMISRLRSSDRKIWHPGPGLCASMTRIDEDCVGAVHYSGVGRIARNYLAFNCFAAAGGVHATVHSLGMQQRFENNTFARGRLVILDSGYVAELSWAWI